MKPNHSNSLLKALPIFVCAFLSCTTQVFAQQTLSDYSVLPENLTGDISTNPNVMIILDNSTSMATIDIPGATGNSNYFTDPETGVRYHEILEFNATTDASSSLSNSYQVRSAMLDILNSDAYEGRLNVGLSTFGQVRCNYDVDGNETTNRTQNSIRLNYTNCNTVGTTGLGQLKANIDVLEGSHRDTLSSLLALEPSSWSAGNTGYLTFNDPGKRLIVFPGGAEEEVTTNFGNQKVNDLDHPIFAQGFVDGNETPILTLVQGHDGTGNATPLGGALDTTFRYMFQNDTVTQGLADGTLPAVYKSTLADREIGLPDITITGDDGSETEVPQTVNYLSASQCGAPMTVILLTDGDPTQTPPTDINGTTVGSTNSGNAARNAATAAAARIRYRGFPDVGAFNTAGFGPSDEVNVYVISFNVLNAAAANSIAVAGGTDSVIETNSTEDVKAAFAGIFDDILTQGATRSGLAIITSPDSATGSFVQPSFTPLTQSALGSTEEVVWTGDLRHFFVDAFGNFRENTIASGTGNELLDAGDKGFRLLYDEDTELTYVEKFNVDTDGTQSGLTGSPDGAGGFDGGYIAVSDLNPIWSARDRLNNLADTEILVAQNRPYSTVATTSNSGRYIFSWADGNSDNVFDTGEQNDFTWSSSGAGKINPANKGMFDLPVVANSDEDAEDLVNFIRGYQATTGNPFRNRIVDGEKYIFGDIVHSTPIQVDGPALSTSFSTDALKENYSSFADFYEDRRKMVYVGANDGMLHAFNGGFWNIDSDIGSIQVDRSINSATSHGLGDELWAYIPNAVLPHLKFLSDSNYSADQHISFVDGSLQSFDVKIFDGDSDNCNVAVAATPSPSCKYINGWGTILVGGLRLGGADYTADFNGDGADETKHSSFFILDITNPESAPVLLDEITSPNLNFTVSQPALMQIESSTPSATNRDYYLVFGSGPDDALTATVTSGSTASLFSYNLKTRGGILTEVSLSDSQSNSFVGDMTSIDWNADDIDDAIYFGTVNGTVDAAGGQLFRTTLSPALSSDVIFNVGKPIQHRPVIPADHQTQDQKYILFGTGRTYSLEDSNFVYAPVNQLYGIQESFVDITSNPVSFGSSPIITSSDILDTNDADLTATADDDIIIDSKTRAEILEDFADGTYKGWLFDLPANTSRLAARPVTVEELVFFSDYQPQDPTIELSDDQCLPSGNSFLSIFDYRSGLFPSADRLIFLDENGDPIDADFTNIQIGASIVGAAEAIFVGEDDDGNLDFKFVAPGANEEIFQGDFKLIPPTGPTPSLYFGRKSWREINL